jgi:serine protease Do
MQISAPVQPCNSGGPVLNGAGQVVGVVVARLSDSYAIETFGSVPQNVNFAIRGEIAKLFLAQNGVEPTEMEAGPVLLPEELADRAQGFTRLVVCN